MSTENSPETSGCGTTPKPPVALIAGPTASGKSDCAVRLAQAIETRGKRAVIINADSQQVYADLRILSARPREDEMGGIEHRLFGTWDGAQACSAADWAEAARREIAECHDDGAVPILVGGTGLYFRTLLDGIAPVPEIDPDIRAEVRQLYAGTLREHLEAEDPEATARLNPQDTQRMARALEVVRSTGKTLSEWQKRKNGGIKNDIDLRPLIILPDREWLYKRCDQRFEWMLENGAVQEVDALLKRKLDPTLPVMRAIGVPEIRAFIEGGSTKDITSAEGQTATRQYAKRQYTWFRNQPPATWPRMEDINFEIEGIFVSLLRKLD
ncbi:tRNA (adenosine(37)-N6)-dimethylallyltransferase MiaA [Erythrobacter sp. W53]|uniref:tRNA (adenosine(37)-N6)-dimethylallyltransferase MiaA n=1 Tax=Erythrobacter sp. W53 TaxID=3425947 RepID=UPI003D769289